MLDETGAAALDSPSSAEDCPSSLVSRLISRKAAVMLGRNTLVSCLVFTLSIGLLWVLVEFLHFDEVVAAAVGFIVANTLHYALGRAWIFEGTDRAVTTGYVLFLFNSGVGLGVTVALYAALLRYTPIDYLVARVLVSLVAGLVIFVLNATLNFRRL